MYFPFRRAGAYVSAGAGYSTASAKPRADGSGTVIVAALGYEWRRGERFAIDLRLNLDRHFYDGTHFDHMWTSLLGLQLRWYL